MACFLDTQPVALIYLGDKMGCTDNRSCDELGEKRYIKGKIEKGAADNQIGEIIQLERFGFARIDKIVGKSIILAFTHK